MDFESKDGDSSPTSNPYMNGRIEWAERYGTYVQSASQWRLISFCLLVIVLVAVGGMVYSSTQNHYIPYVVQVDRLGVAVAAGRADVAAKADTRILRAQLARWIVNVRSVYVDAAAQRSAVDESYAMVSRNGSSYNRLNEFYRANDPFVRAQKETVTVEVKTVLPIGGETWRVEWIETTRSRNGEVQQRDEWQASVTTQVSPPSDETTILRNPLGIFTPDFDWTKRSVNSEK